jgi:hypothetical protein
VRVRGDLLGDPEQDRRAQPLIRTRPYPILRRAAAAVIVGVLCVVAVACDARTPADSQVDPASDVGPSPSPTLRSKLEPYAYGRPAPPATPTVIDGVYSMFVSFEEAGGKAISCRRCAPYRLDPGEATLIFDRGRFYVSLVPVATKRRCRQCKGIPAFEATGHFDVSGTQLVLYNDASCTHGIGTYRWSIRSNSLDLQPTKDGCFTGLRSRFLSASAWTQET